MKTLSIDTNILVRLLIIDNAQQNEAVERLFMNFRFFVLWTVLLEAEWVLRKVFRADVLRVNDLFRSLLSDGLIEIEHPEAFIRVIDLHAAGMDFADAAHLCLTKESMTFVTFDRDLVRRAKKYMPDAKVELAV